MTVLMLLLLVVGMTAAVTHTAGSDLGLLRKRRAHGAMSTGGVGRTAKAKESPASTGPSSGTGNGEPTSTAPSFTKTAEPGSTLPGATTKAKPATNNKKPASSNKKPMAATEKPMATTKKPMATKKPGAAKKPAKNPKAGAEIPDDPRDTDSSTELSSVLDPSTFDSDFSASSSTKLVQQQMAKWDEDESLFTGLDGLNDSESTGIGSSSSSSSSSDSSADCPMHKLARTWAKMTESANSERFQELYAPQAVRLSGAHLAGSGSSTLSLDPDAVLCVSDWRPVHIDIDAAVSLSTAKNGTSAGAVRFVFHYNGKRSRGLLLWRFDRYCRVIGEAQWVDGRTANAQVDDRGAWEDLVLDARSCASRPSPSELRHVTAGRRQDGSTAYIAALEEHPLRASLLDQVFAGQEPESLVDDGAAATGHEEAAHLLPGEKPNAAVLAVAIDVGSEHTVKCPAVAHVKDGPFLSTSFIVAPNVSTENGGVEPSDWCDAVSAPSVGIRFRSVYDYCERDGTPGLRAHGHGRGLLLSDLENKETAIPAVTRLMMDADGGAGDVVLQRWALRGDDHLVASLTGGEHGTAMLRLDLRRLAIADPEESETGSGSSSSSSSPSGQRFAAQDTDEQVATVVCRMVGRRTFDRPAAQFVRAMEARCEMEIDGIAALSSPLSALALNQPDLQNALDLGGCPDRNRYLAFELDVFAPPHREGTAGGDAAVDQETDASTGITNGHDDPFTESMLELFVFDLDGDGGVPPLVASVGKTAHVTSGDVPVYASIRRRPLQLVDAENRDPGALAMVQQLRAVFTMGVSRAEWDSYGVGQIGLWPILLGAREPLIRIRLVGGSEAGSGDLCLMPAVVSAERISIVGASAALGKCPPVRMPGASAAEWRLVTLGSGGVSQLVHDRTGTCLTHDAVGTLRFWPCGVKGSEVRFQLYADRADDASAPFGGRRIHLQDPALTTDLLDWSQCLFANKERSWMAPCKAKKSGPAAPRFVFEPTPDDDSTARDQLRAQCWGVCLNRCVGEPETIDDVHDQRLQAGLAEEQAADAAINASEESKSDGFQQLTNTLMPKPPPPKPKSRVVCGVDCAKKCTSDDESAYMGSGTMVGLDSKSVSKCFVGCSQRDCSGQTELKPFRDCQRQCALLCS